MKIRHVHAALSLALLAAPVQAGGEACQDPLVVHEWGTFTSMQGADGVGLEGLQREEESLPEFVYGRSEVQDCPLRGQGYKGLEQPARGVRQKMETPVIYFHTKTPRRVKVRVDYVGGLITQWYPVSDTLGPPEGERGAAPLDLAKVERSFLEWQVDLLPNGKKQPVELPAVAADDPWSFAREVDAAWVRTVPRSGERLGPVEAERYLFYRGLGNGTLPLVAQGHANVVVAMNRGQERIPAAFGLTVKAGRMTWTAIQGGISPGGGIKHGSNVLAEGGKPLAEGMAELQAAVHRALVAEGLFEDEARAMVRTWARSWFASEGTRILWIVPRAETDALLPLAIEPAPAKLVRVLVGRLEVITPEVEAELAAALLDRRSDDQARRAAAEKRLHALERFLEPHLRLMARSKEAAVRESAAELLAGLK